MAEDWFKRHVEKQGLISNPEIRRQLDKYVYPEKWGTTKFLDIRRGNVVAALLDHIEDSASAEPWRTTCWRPCAGS